MTASNPHQLLAMQDQLLRLRDQALALEQRFAPEIAACPPQNRGSASNLIHYLSVRQHDIRPLQQNLSRYGLSSLSVLEAFTLAHLNAVLDVLQTLTGCPLPAPPPPVDYSSGPQCLQARGTALLGTPNAHRGAHIMVTMPSEAATHPQLVSELLGAGMSLMRINCAHDHPSAWQAMVANLRSAVAASDRPCRIQADLGGPKLRTGPIQSRGRLLKLKPKRDLYGVVLEPCRIWLHSRPAAAGPSSLHRALLVADEFIQACAVGDHVQLTDCRGQRRKLKIVQTAAAGFIAELSHTAYLSPDTVLRLKRGQHTLASAQPLGLPEVVQPILLLVGDELVLSRDPHPGTLEQRDSCGRLQRPARVHCSLAQAFDQVQPGHRVWFDDGRIGAEVLSCDGREMRLRVTQAAPGGSRLKAEKGINFPDTEMEIPALTEKDLADLSQVAEWADIVALSFVRRPDDLQALHQALLELGKPDTGIVLKIENRQAFENLPRILLAGLQCGRPLGVMIARGDLAVEMGFDRLSEVQQEILWICEAAHVPVIWATQILESLAKRGVPSRAEVTDAGMSVVAECVMLNKGPYIVAAVTMLDNILRRMDQHYHKRRATLRPLSVARL
ncbi:MAG: pyruvate kinase [Pseudomonadales bacterium]|nr:pyruvate kinase [Pseudomonadales bacterium]